MVAVDNVKTPVSEHNNPNAFKEEDTPEAANNDYSSKYYKGFQNTLHKVSYIGIL